jgi:hypothetical protein
LYNFGTTIYKMKILLLCEGRCGSYSLMEWIQNDLHLKIIGESLPYNHTDNDIIVKRTLSHKDFDLKDVKYFDKVIILYREDTLSQAESAIWAVENKNWHHSPYKLDGFYELNDDWLLLHNNQISNLKCDYDILLKQYKLLEFGLHITYEDVFENKNLQTKIEDYIGFIATTILVNPNNKLRRKILI